MSEGRDKKWADECKHCGQPISKRPYGSTFRWEHVGYFGTGWTYTGVWCNTTEAEPKG